MKLNKSVERFAVLSFHPVGSGNQIKSNTLLRLRFTIGFYRRNVIRDKRDTKRGERQKFGGIYPRSTGRGFKPSLIVAAQSSLLLIGQA